MNKYRNKKVMTDEGAFDSQKEYHRWCELKLLEKAGHIHGLQRQVKYELIPTKKPLHKCSYIADFVYFTTDPIELIVEDTKGVRTKEYQIKKKLMYEKYDILIKEI